MNFAGAIEFDKKRAYFFASLYESRVLFITLDGEMGLLIGWGNDAAFVLSVGGFHPAFNPPPLPFPNPKRICISILDHSNARIRVTGYFAITSNTVQFGAKAELYFGFSSCNVKGHISFDALIQFNPFYFIIQISASLTLKVFGVDVLSIRLKFALEGPSPWRAKGSGSISILFFEISVDFDITWGEKKNTSLPPIEVMPLILAEYEKSENWTTKLPESGNLLVTLTKIDLDEGQIVLHPAGVLKISQRTIPLDLTLDKMGSQKPEDFNKFSFKLKSPGLAVVADAKESFARAQFEEMDDSSKLSHPSFEKLTSGAELAASGVTRKTSKLVKRNARYEQIIIDNNFKQFKRRFFHFWGGLFNFFLKGSAITKSVLSMKYQKQRQPFKDKIEIIDDFYFVASCMDNTAVNGSQAGFTSQAMAEEYLREQIAQHPNLAGNMHVIPGSEINAA